MALSAWVPRCAALCIGVGSFDERFVGAPVELPFASDQGRAVARALRRFGFDPLVLHDVDADADEINKALSAIWSASPKPDLAVVHLIGHGERDKSGRLRFVGHSGRGVDVDATIVDAQQSGIRRVVILLDVCGAGLAAGARWSSQLEGWERRVWVVGACGGDSITSGGRFSQAIAEALHAIADTDYPTVDEPVNFTAFSRHLLRAAHTRGCERPTRNHDLELDDGTWPMLPNPLSVWLSAQRGAWATRALDYLPALDIGAVIAALERGGDIEDPAHFADRASGRGMASGDLRRGLFTGRTAELERIGQWLASAGGLFTVRGGPGAGKSALLGVVVCAGHEQLRVPLRALWREVPGAPRAPITDLIAAHARQRSAGEVMDAIAAQAGLSEGPLSGTLGASRAGWSAQELRSALAGAPARVLVVDAVDESTEPQATAELIRVLAQVDPDTGRPAARVLAGARPEIADLFSGVAGAVELDLDAVDRHVLTLEVHAYLDRLLEMDEHYGATEFADVREAIATHASPRLSAAIPPGEVAWGPFLVAGMFAHYLTNLSSPPRDLLTAEAFAKQAGPLLTEMLELDLAARAERFPLLRPVLAALARGRGEGMPRSVLRRAATAFLPEAFAVSRELTESAVRTTLALAHPYLRIGVDQDSGEKLYRLFHQGLADHLRARPFPGQDQPGLDSQRALERLMLTRMLRLPDPPDDPILAEDEDHDDR